MGDTENRLPDRLARREHDVPVPEPDNVDALAATLADWGAEHRPNQPCTACGCTLYWTAAGADMCAVCLPMPRISDVSWERIARMLPRRPRGPQQPSADAWSKPPQFGDTVRRDRSVALTVPANRLARDRWPHLTLNVSFGRRTGTRADGGEAA